VRAAARDRGHRHRENQDLTESLSWSSTAPGARTCPASSPLPPASGPPGPRATR